MGERKRGRGSIQGHRQTNNRMYNLQFIEIEISVRATVLKLGSADPWGSARGPQGVREKQL